MGFLWFTESFEHPLKAILKLMTVHLKTISMLWRWNKAEATWKDSSWTKDESSTVDGPLRNPILKTSCFNGFNGGKHPMIFLGLKHHPFFWWKKGLSQTIHSMIHRYIVHQLLTGTLLQNSQGNDGCGWINLGSWDIQQSTGQKNHSTSRNIQVSIQII